MALDILQCLQKLCKCLWTPFHQFILSNNNLTNSIAIALVFFPLTFPLCFSVLPHTSLSKKNNVTVTLLNYKNVALLSLVNSL